MENLTIVINWLWYLLLRPRRSNARNLTRNANDVATDGPMGDADECIHSSRDDYYGQQREI